MTRPPAPDAAAAPQPAASPAVPSEASATSVTSVTGVVPAEAIIRVVGVRKSFGAREVLKGIDLDIARGSVVVILGGSGMGKSVLMKHIIGLLQPDTGQIVVDGEDISRMTPLQLKRVRSKFGMVFQNGALFDSMSNWENVAFPLREHRHDLKGPALEQRVRELFELFSLDVDVLGPRSPSEISGGQRKRVALARAVALEPAIVLYDEPTTGLDPITTDQVDEMILAAKRKLGVTSIVISHDIASAFKIADHIIFIYDGQIVARGLKQEMLSSAHPFVQRFFATWSSKNA
jgi:phospholipid/cholesterol/gamma-HCH transport system ATP-binding protein